ncbi:MAG: NfeD family protein [Desulforhopalus sp.]|nr:NfeD family protein [Desulforhopalus sp.]
MIDYPGLYWLIIGVTLGVLELAVPGLVLFFFAVGALITALITAFFPQLAIVWQLLTFILTSLAFLALLRGVLMRRFLAPSEVDIDSMDDGDVVYAKPGDHATVTLAINPPAIGQIKYGGTFWSATASVPVEAGNVVSIVRQKNLVMEVETLQKS